MMNWYGGGMGGGAGLFWLLMGVFWIALVALVVYLVVKLLPGSSRPSAPPVPPGTQPTPVESPEQILDRLFALGEIDEETYRARRTALTEMRRSS